MFLKSRIVAAVTMAALSCTAWPAFTGAAAAVKSDSSGGTNPALLLAILGSQVATASAPPCSPCYLFVTSVNTGVAVGQGVSGLDALCATRKNTDAPSAPGLATAYRALVMAEDGTRTLSNNWVLHPNTEYLTASNANLSLGITDSSSRFPATLTNPIQTTGNTIWTGIDTTTWIPYAAGTCTSWTTGGNGRTGMSNFANSTSFSNSFNGCAGSPIYLYCVQQ